MHGIDLFRLEGRVALITGGSKGLGQAMARGLASAGADLLLTSRNEVEVQQTAEDIAGQYPSKVIGLGADVTKPEDAQRAVDHAVEKLGKIDILINNAGINIRGPIEDLTPEQFQQVMETNTTGPWLMCRAVARHMKHAGYGRVVNISSTLGAVGLADRSPYATSKGALVMMTKVLALEWAEQGITVNAICPGPFLTPMNEPVANTEFSNHVIGSCVAMRRWGELHEIQGAAIYLASDASSFVTGTTLFVDGGWTAH